MKSQIETLPLIQQSIEAVEQLMLSQADTYNENISNALSTLVSSGGKRIRPKLILLLGSILNGNQDELITLAASVELLHTATLVHDDLIDESILRRGVPTLNSKWSPSATILTGDFIFACAAGLSIKLNSSEVMSLFTKTMMTIANGEINQLFSSSFNLSQEEYFDRIYAKTASLFEMCAQSSAIICKSANVLIEKMRIFGFELGIAFQIVDDVLDYRGDQSIAGKPVGGDLRHGIITLPLLKYIELFPQDKLIQQLFQQKSINNNDLVDQVIQTVSASSAIDLSIVEAQKHADLALSQLSGLPESPEKEALKQLTEISVVRKK